MANFSLNFKELSFSLPTKHVQKDNEKPIHITKRFMWIYVAILSVISVVSWIFYYSQGLTLSYNDARSHLDVARRVIDNLQPGFAQIGSVWLPLFHIFELPFIWNYTLWQTGIAGSIISMISYVIGGVFILLLSKQLRFSFLASLVTAGLYALNPNIVFMQSTPMTELLLLSTSFAGVYYIVRWVESFSIIDLILAGLFTFLASLTRYDGWFLFLFMSGVVSYVSLKKGKFRTAEGATLFFVTLAGLGIVMWFAWNLLIFKNPLYFAIGPYSAKAQQDILQAQGRLLTKGNAVYSIVMFVLVIKENLGLLVSLLSVAGVWVLAASKKLSLFTKIAVGLLLVPIIFNILSLVTGDSVVYLPYIFPFTWFNDRYGLMLIPAAAIAVGAVANKGKLFSIIVGSILLMSVATMYLDNAVITIQDDVRGASGNFLNDTGDWVGANAKTGLILVASASNDALEFRSKLPLNHFISEGDQKYWAVSLADPAKYSQSVILHKGDTVYASLIGNKKFLQNFHLVYRSDFAYIYEKNTHPMSNIPKEDLP